MDTRAIIGVIDNLTSNSTTDALSANQGRVLKGLIDNIGSDLPLLVGTDSKVIVIDNLVNGVYMLTGKYKYTNKTAIGTTSERLMQVIIISLVHHLLFN
jgi:hypothetical protein